MNILIYKCIKSLYIYMYGDDGEFLDDYIHVVEDSIWEIEETEYRSLLSRDDIRLVNNLGLWIEIYEDTLLEHFELVNG